MRRATLYSSNRNSDYRPIRLPRVPPCLLTANEVTPYSGYSTLREIIIYPTAIFYSSEGQSFVRIQFNNLSSDSLETTTWIFKIPNTFAPPESVIRLVKEEPDSTTE